VQHPNWQPNFMTFIAASNKEEVASYICTKIDDIKIFSGLKEKIGTVAIRPDTEDVLHFQLGSSR
jgi:hypothetical protein